MTDKKITCICGKHEINDEDIKATDFLLHSNLIENEWSAEALIDAHKAWEYALTLNKVELHDVLEIHHLIMQRLDPRIAGSLRKVPARVGSQPCPNPGSVRRMLYQHLGDFNVDFSRLETPFMEDVARALHVEFERIHPFEDGNGRVGRILYNWLRVKNHLPIHVIHEGVEQQEYYKWFRGPHKVDG